MMERMLAQFRGAAWLVAVVTLPSALHAQSAQPTIVVDPGHPSETSNGAAIHKGTTEVHINWLVAQRLATLLRAHGYTVVMTKHSEDARVTNAERARVGNRA